MQVKRYFQKVIKLGGRFVAASARRRQSLEQAATIVMAILVLAPVVIIALGWIAPLVLAVLGHRRRWASARNWRILAIVWGCVSLALAIGMGGLIYAATRISRGYGSGLGEARLFEPATHPGKTSILRTACSGEVDLVFSVDSGKTLRCASSNGTLVVPAGSLAVSECRFTAPDAGGKPWTASIRFWNETNLAAAAGAVQELGLGPPFLLAANMDWAPVSSKISLAPACADRAGNIYTIKCNRDGLPPVFRVLNAANQVVWSGNFEFG